MPVDPEIRRLAADPDALFVIRIIDCFFESMVEGKEEAMAKQMIETSWRLLKRGVFRLYDEEIDDDDAPIKASLTTAERDRARRMGAKLFAVRQRLRRVAGSAPSAVVERHDSVDRNNASRVPVRSDGTPFDPDHPGAQPGIEGQP